MDEVLKSRKMSSASARRRKFQERQQQQALEVERRQQHKRRVMMYDHLAEHSDEAENDSGDDNEERFDRESSVDTPSERSVLTPDESLENRSTFRSLHKVETSSIALKVHIPDEEQDPDMGMNGDGVMGPPTPSPILQASLATLSDFRYDRYSTLLESPLSELISPDLDTDETFSPIETATPIAYQLPKTRPSLISITTNSSTRSKRRTPSTQSPLSQTMSQTIERPTKRQSTTSTHSGFPAAEATLFEVPDLPANAFDLIANASQESLPILLNQPKTRAERKSSVPRLSTALNHARVSSIKSLIKTPTSATHSRSFSRTSTHASRPSTASISGIDGFALRNTAASSSTTNLSLMQRPLTSMSISSIGSNSNHHPMTALPSLPTPPADDSISDPLAATKSMSRKKSFSALRRRSESIGQAIKGLGKTSTKHDVPMPTPASFTPRIPSKSVLDLSGFPTPPMPSPRTGKSITSSYISPMERSSSGAIGLGLRSMEGFWQK